jgi:hypothetical protein
VISTISRARNSGVASQRPFSREEALAVQPVVEGIERCGEPHQRALLRVLLPAAVQVELDAGEDQEDAEHVDEPMEAREQRGAREDHQRTQHQRGQDPPEQHAVLGLEGDAEAREDHQEHEDVVDGERLLDQVAGQELDAGLRAEAPRHEGVERQREADPRHAPAERLAEADHVGLAVEHAEVEGEHPSSRKIRKSRIDVQVWPT